MNYIGALLSKTVLTIRDLYFVGKPNNPATSIINPAIMILFPTNILILAVQSIFWDNFIIKNRCGTRPKPIVFSFSNQNYEYTGKCKIHAAWILIPVTVTT